jgi:hypothetical protein
LAAVAGSDTETRLLINVAALLILAIEARRIAANVAKLPGLLQRGYCFIYRALDCRLAEACVEPMNQTETPIKIGQAIIAIHCAQGRTSARRKAPISTPTQSK